LLTRCVQSVEKTINSAWANTINPVVCV
jgi:hypothetical protein